MDGKTKCKILKGIRQRIADINEIEYAPHPCSATGNCLGTCPQCDNELLWLEKQLLSKTESGMRVYLTSAEIQENESCLYSKTYQKIVNN